MGLFRESPLDPQEWGGCYRFSISDDDIHLGVVDISDFECG